MAKGKSLNDVLAEGDQIAHVWEANPTFSLGDATLAGLRQDLDDLRVLQGQGRIRCRTPVNLQMRIASSSNLQKVPRYAPCSSALSPGRH